MALRELPSRSLESLQPEREGVISLAAEDASTTRRHRRVQKWQTDAWGHFDTHGEVHYPLTVGANLASRVDLVIQERNSDGRWVAATDPHALACYEAVLECGMDDFWRSHSILTGVAGEGVMLYRSTPMAIELCSNEEVFQEASGRWVRTDGSGSRDVLDLAVWRVVPFHRRHPRFRSLPDSGLRSVLNECRELQLLKLALLAKISSRLASVGILFLPNTLSMPAPDNASGTLSGDQLTTALKTMFMAPLANPGGAAAAMPVLLRGPEDAGEKIRHIILDTSLDEVEEQHRQELRRAIANGIELPIETQTSVADTNHWQAWHVSESALHDHIMPMCRGGAQLITTRILRPWMTVRGKAPDRFRFWVDGHRAALGLNGTDRARQVFNLGGLSLNALRDAHGFDDTAAPSAEEVVRWIGVKMNNPAMATYGLGIDLPPEILSGPTPPGQGGFAAPEPMVDAGLLPGDPSAGLDQS